MYPNTFLPYHFRGPKTALTLLHGGALTRAEMTFHFTGRKDAEAAGRPAPDRRSHSSSQQGRAGTRSPDFWEAGMCPTVPNYDRVPRQVLTLGPQTSEQQD